MSRNSLSVSDSQAALCDTASRRWLRRMFGLRRERYPVSLDSSALIAAAVRADPGWHPDELVEIMGRIEGAKNPRARREYIAGIEDLVVSYRAHARVRPYLFLGSAYFASRMRLLRKFGITHILNCAQGVPEYFPGRFRYLGLELRDEREQSLAEALATAEAFEVVLA